ncbi:hypothetical protein KIPB_011403 [Kipferlia bialata]|uniref:Uncharacterized protein n=1 Tax=Kipferlia bialata TaxID=797122 RepID=A0A9K3D5L3_9EUKA|nr:hypothetical protein KIPB_011403 [Kipferlia bialata]|eukprot:g11403.t1
MQKIYRDAMDALNKCKAEQPSAGSTAQAVREWRREHSKLNTRSENVFDDLQKSRVAWQRYEEESKAEKRDTRTPKEMLDAVFRESFLRDRERERERQEAKAKAAANPPRRTRRLPIFCTKGSIEWAELDKDGYIVETRNSALDVPGAIPEFVPSPNYKYSCCPPKRERLTPIFRGDPFKNTIEEFIPRRYYVI